MDLKWSGLDVSYRATGATKDTWIPVRCLL